MLNNENQHQTFWKLASLKRIQPMEVLIEYFHITPKILNQIKPDFLSKQ